MNSKAKKFASLNEARKSRTCWLICTILSLVIEIFTLVVGPFMGLPLWLIPLCGVIIGAVFIVSIIKFSQRHEEVIRLTDTICSCGSAYQYPDDVSYEIIPSIETLNNPARVDVKAECVCGKCGKNKIVRHSFRVPPLYTAEEVIEDYFRQI